MIDKTIKLTHTLAKPTEASKTGSFIRPANTPFTTTDKKASRFVKTAGMAIFKKHMNILPEVGGSLDGSNMFDSSYSAFKDVVDSKRGSFLSFNYSVSLTSF